MRALYLFATCLVASLLCSGCADTVTAPADHGWSSAPGNLETPPAPDPVAVCDLLHCGDSPCLAAEVRCDCPPGTFFDGVGCEAERTCAVDSDCGAPLGCATPRCTEGTCTEVIDQQCALPACPTPTAPVLSPIAEHYLNITAPAEFPVRYRWRSNGSASGWIRGAQFAIGAFAGNVVSIEAQVDSRGCDALNAALRATYSVATRYSPPPGVPDSVAIAHNSEQVTAWASKVSAYSPAPGVEASWADPSQALGPASDSPFHATSLGEGGSITLQFHRSFGDQPGVDLVVFENGFDDRFLELATVSVSTNGNDWATFDTATHNMEGPDSWLQLSSSQLTGFAGTFRAGFGVPFDLTLLRTKAAVRDGLVDLGNLQYVRINDVVGDGTTLDSFGRPIYDPWPTVESAGFDLDAIGLIAPLPAQ